MADQSLSNDYISLEISCKTISTEKRFQGMITTRELKNRLELMTGVMAVDMELVLFANDERVVDMKDDEATLESHLSSNQRKARLRLDVKDKSGASEDVLDTNQVEKFELTEEEYNQKTDSVRAFKAQNKLGRFNEEAAQKRQEELEQREALETEKAGQRCEVRVLGQPTRRGQVMFVGETKFKPGAWVGVALDEPLGKNNGTVAGVRYFECRPKYGSFVRPSDVTVGDFPPEDDDLEEL
jgi:tubulin-folding cofactor B